MSEEVVAREIPGPGTWHWKISPEDVEKIKKGDRETIDRVYFDNYKKFYKFAYRFCRDKNRLSYVEDCIQEVYLDLPMYDYSNVKTFFRGLLRTFICCSFNRIRTVSLFSPIGRNKDGEEFTLIDVLGIDFFKDLEEREDGERNAINIISAQHVLSDIEKDFLTAVAFRCTPYRGLYNDEYKRLIAKEVRCKCHNR